MSRVARTLWASAFSLFIVLPSIFAQQGPDPAAAPTPQKLTKETKKKMKRTLKELDSSYRQWLSEDVTYIISPDERNAFLQLDTNEEREQFIEQFWLRRSSNPDLPDNDFKEEHYRRIAYANEHYASGIPGWKTDRGRMYIMWGPADEVDSHPSGGTYDRPMEEGGGSTTTYPWETWRWRYLEGIGENIILEFVDPSGSGEFHLTMDPSEKDALLHVPGAGLSLMESMGMASKADRFTRSDGTNLPTSMGGEPASMNEFNRLELYAKVNKPPEVKFKDLEAVVTSRIVRDQVHFIWRTDYLKVTNDTVLVPVTVQIPNSQLSFQAKEGIHSATLNVFGRVSTLTGRVVQTFEDTVTRDFPDTLYQQSLKLQSIYQKAVPLRPGLYRLDLVIKDVQSGNIGVVNSRLQVPRYEDDKLEASSLILADQIEHVPAKQIGAGQFVLGSSKVRPRLDGDFTTADRLGIYMQVYNLKPDDKSHKSSATFQYTGVLECRTGFVRLVVRLQVVNLHVNAQPVGSGEITIKTRPDLRGAQHELSCADLLCGDMLDLIGKNQRTGFQLVIFVPRHLQARVHDSDISALYILDHQVQTVQARAKWNSLLINRLELQGLLVKRIREIAGDGIFKCLHDTPGQRAYAPEHIEHRGVNSILSLIGKLAIRDLHGDGHEHRVVRHFQVIGPPSEVHLIADDAGGYHRFEILKLHLRRFIDLGIEFQAVELVHAGWLTTHAGRQIGAVGTREAVGLRCHAHGFHQTQTRAWHVQERVFFRWIHRQVKLP